MAYYRSRDPLKPEELTIGGIRRRLRKLEHRLQDIPSEEDNRTWEERVAPEDRVTIDELLGAIKRLRLAIADIDRVLLEKAPLNFTLPSVSHDSMSIPFPYNSHIVDQQFTLIERLVTESRSARLSIERNWIYARLFPKWRKRRIEALSSTELSYARLFDYRRVLRDTAYIIDRGLKCRWPEIIQLRLLLARRENEKQTLLRSRLFAPVPPSPHDILKARVAAADRKARDAISAIRAKIPKTERCPYCDKVVGNKGYHLDHIVPVARGGISSEDNLVYVCLPCNQKKHNLGLTAFAKQQGIAVEPLIERLHRMGKHL